MEKFDYSIHFEGKSKCCEAPVKIHEHTCTECDTYCEVIIDEPK